jgi:hypothetical protein
MNAVLLAAPAGDTGALIKLAIFVLVILLPAVGRLLANLRTRNDATARPRRLGNSQDQINEFLRRAAERQAAGQTRQPPRAAKAESPVTAEVVPEDVVGGRVNAQVKQYLDTSEFGRRTDKLGGEVSQADEQFQERSQTVFAGDVGSLARRPGEAAASPQAIEVPVDSEESRPQMEAMALPGAGLADLLGSPDNILHAVIMTQILQRREWTDD